MSHRWLVLRLTCVLPAIPEEYIDVLHQGRNPAYIWSPMRTGCVFEKGRLFSLKNLSLQKPQRLAGPGFRDVMRRNSVICMRAAARRSTARRVCIIVGSAGAGKPGAGIFPVVGE
jgi:hypothetical protein